ncbi:MAG TPA: DUF2066 domain-containing protein [Stellaceae bacterium]|nr:DUF2066 domain-containing protein [Stellaceae bacterium]
MPLRLALTLILLAAGIVVARTAAAADLYRATAFVTGEGEAERARGFALCLDEVLVKVSGDPSILRAPALARLHAEAAGLVAGFSYHDRMSGIPVHDEQGTRERPFDLTVAFDAAKIDATLARLGRKPWREPRPRIAVLLGVRDATASYVLAEDGARGLGQRQSLAQTAGRHGIPLALPKTALLDDRRVTYAKLTVAPAKRLDALAQASGGDAALGGTLVWTEARLGWTARWRLVWHGRERRWQVSGVSFDDAFRNAIDHAAAILSGHG